MLSQSHSLPLPGKPPAAAALLKAGALQSAIFNSANFSSIATDANGVIQIFNVGAERMLGYTALEVMNKVTPAEISDPQEVIARAKTLTAERAFSGEHSDLRLPVSQKDRRLSGMRLLVAEDNALNQEVIEQILTRATASADPAPQRSTPALVLAGLEVAAALKAFGGDEKSDRVILRKFLLQQGGDVDEAQRLFTADDAEGAIRLLQATELTRQAMAAEAALRAGNVMVMPVFSLNFMRPCVHCRSPFKGSRNDMWMFKVAADNQHGAHVKFILQPTV